MPNGRTIYKRLMKNRTSVFWGRRSYVTVSLPADLIALPEPPTDLVRGLGEERMGGAWVRDLDDGTAIVTHIGHIYGGTEHVTDGEGELDDRTVVHIEPDQYDKTYCSWYEGTQDHRRYTPGDRENLNFPFDRVEDSELDLGVSIETVEQYIAHSDWFNGYVEASRYGLWPKLHPVHRAFVNIFCKKTHRACVTDGRLYIEYAVKWFYPEERYGFANELKKAFKLAKEHGIDARLLKR